MTEKESPFACDMTAIAPEQRGAHVATIEKLFRSVQSKRELPDGYAFELPNNSDVLLTAAELFHLSAYAARSLGLSYKLNVRVDRSG